MEDRRHGRRRDPDRPTSRARLLGDPARLPVRLLAFLVAGVGLFGVSGSMGPERPEAAEGLIWLRETLGGFRVLHDGDGLVISGAVAIVTGVVCAAWCLAVRRPGANVTRIGMSLAAVIWGLGQLLTGLEAGLFLPSPTAGDLISALSVPTVMVALLAAPRGSSAAWPRLRLMLDAAAVGLAAAFGFWQLAVASGPGRWTVDGPVVCALVAADVTVLALVSLSTVRDVRGRLWPTALGVGLVAAADMAMVVQSPDFASRDVGAFSTVLWCLAWPLTAIGVARYRGPSESSPRAQDLREVASAQFAAVTVLLLVMAGMFAGRMERPDVTGLVLLAEVLVLLCLRELVDSLLQLQLTTVLREQALRDGLTGLLNRHALVQQVVALSGQAQGWLVLTVDVDRFKEINDLFGHRAADDLLTSVGGVLARERPAGADAYRIGGDEFAVLARGDLDEGRRLAYRLQTALASVLAEAAPGMTPSVSVGVGRLVGDDDDRPRRHPLDRPEIGQRHKVAAARHELSALVESAAALKAAKEAGPGSVEVYSGPVAAERERRVLLESRLRTALATGRIRTVAQPIVDLYTGRITGFEALARWRDEELGEISPVEFIAIAEQTGMVVDLGSQVLRVSVEQATAAGVFAAGATVSVNVSPIQLRVPGFVDLMRETLERHRVPEGLVVVEVTEAVMVTEDDPALRALAELNALGVPVAIDDFGTGYSALGYLRRLPVQILKIDRSLTISLASEPKTTAIVEGVVRMAHRMDIKVVMEGIEDELEAESCRAIEADKGQGWLYGRPAEWHQVGGALRDNGPGLPVEEEPEAVVGAVKALPAQREHGEAPESAEEPVSEPKVHAGH